MKILSIITIFLLSSIISLFSAEIPSGNGTAEGVACDAVQSYIDSDSKAWLKTLVRPIYGGEGDKEYAKFKKQMVKNYAANKGNENFVAPKIIKVFKARNFSKNGPGSMAYALYGMVGNVFVDIVLDVGKGKTQSIRYHVLCDKDKKWYFEPRPDLAPLLSMGLNQETISQEVLWDSKATTSKE